MCASLFTPRRCITPYPSPPLASLPPSATNLSSQERVVRSLEKCEFASGQVVVEQGEEALTHLLSHESMNYKQLIKKLGQRSAVQY